MILVLGTLIVTYNHACIKCDVRVLIGFDGYINHNGYTIMHAHTNCKSRDLSTYSAY